MLKPHFRDCLLGRHLLSCTRCLHIQINFGLLVFAAAALYVTATAYSESNAQFLLYYKYVPLNVMVITGWAGVLAIAAFLGIYSSIRLSSDGLVINAVILILLIAGSLGYTIWQGVTADYSKSSEMFKELRDHMKHYVRNEDIVDTLQTTLSCCGVEGFEDWTGKIPSSCCSRPSDICDAANPSLNRNGCYDALRPMISNYNWIIWISLTLINAIQSITATLSYVLCRTVACKVKNEVEAPPESEATTEAEATPDGEVEPAPEPEAIPPPPPPPPPPMESEEKCIHVPKVNISNHVA